MGTGLVIALAAAAALLALACLWLSLVLGRVRRGNRRLAQELTALQARLEKQEGAASDPPATAEIAPPPTRHRDEAEYVITTAGVPALKQPAPPSGQTPQVDARQFASVAVGESLVRIVSLAYGVRRALSAENRNRIGFEVGREIRRARRRRRAELREARRHLRATQREEDAA
jgi:hypothetical protein